jgi:hypothetical protein
VNLQQKIELTVISSSNEKAKSLDILRFIGYGLGKNGFNYSKLKMTQFLYTQVHDNLINHLKREEEKYLKN